MAEKFRNLSAWHVSGVACTLILIALLAVGLLRSIFDKGAGSAEAAAWAQAFGSFGAIVGAFWIAYSERRRSAKDAENESIWNRTVSAQSLRTLTGKAVRIMEMALDHAETQGAHGTSTFTLSRLDHIRVLLERFVTSADAYASSVALQFIDDLWETRESYLGTGDFQLSKHFTEQISSLIEAAKQRQLAVARLAQELEQECYARHLALE